MMGSLIILVPMYFFGITLLILKARRAQSNKREKLAYLPYGFAFLCPFIFFLLSAWSDHDALNATGIVLGICIVGSIVIVTFLAIVVAVVEKIFRIVGR
ncbi:MAG: hypothetical protein ABI230_10300 [Aestuariivirga sp.]